MPPHPHRYLLPIAAFLAILPMLLYGPSPGHDFNFHLLSWLEAARQYAHGLYPHWAYTPAYNAGEPRFVFYPPISWTLGALLTTLLPHHWPAVPIVFIFIALTLAGFTAYHLCRDFAPAPIATLAATLYVVNPYMLFTAYERSAFAELLAAAFLPLLFRAALAPRPRIVPLAISIALLWLTNAPAAVMGCYALAFLTLVRLILPSTPRKLHLALTTTAGTALGLLLAAFYILPAAYERRFVHIDMALVEGLRITDHFLFHRMPGGTPDDLFHDAVVRTASYIAVALLLTIATALALSRKRPLPLILLAAAIALLLTPLSLPLWNHIPQLAFLQFPWRLNALLAVIATIALTQTLKRLTIPYSRAGSPPSGLCSVGWLLPTPCLILTMALVGPAWHAFHQPNSLEGPTNTRIAHMQLPQGNDPTDEYTPTVADNDALHPGNPPFWTSCTDNPAEPPPANSIPAPLPNHLALTVPCPGILILNRRDFPAWHITLNGYPATPLPAERDDGLIALAVPAGPAILNLTYTQTPDRTLGELLSALAALTLATLAVRRIDYTHQVEP